MRVLGLVLALVALVATGCGGDDDRPEEGSAREPPEAAETTSTDGGGTVDMNDQLAFKPKRIEVAVGERVTWRNAGKVGHTVTADKSQVADRSLVSIPGGTKEWDSGLVNGGQSFSRTFERAGTYRYVCIPHEGAGMVGTVVVR